MNDVRIQIVNYKTKGYLVECLRTLLWSLKDSEICYSVAILDNASGDDLTDLVTTVNLPNLEIHHSNKNVGFGAGHNLLARLGDARHLFLLNPDTKILVLHTLQSLVRRAIETEARVIGPRLVTERGTTQQWDHGELDGWIARIALKSGNSFWREREEVVPAAWISGAAFLIEKQWFDDLGGFDEKFFLYKEEEDLCWRVRAHGGKIIYDPTLSVFHHCGVVAKKSEHLWESTDYFLQKHFRNHFAYSLFRLINKLIH
jgi:GT2 family glycosyltransferase